MPSFFMQNKKYIGISLIAVLVIAAMLFMTMQSKENPPTESITKIEETANPSAQVNEANKAVQSNSPQQQLTSSAIVIDVKGAVKKPGVYRLDQDARVQEAIQEAGGFNASANPKLINLAAKLQDEMVVYVPRKGEKTPELGSLAPQQSTSLPGTTTATTVEGQKLVNLNTADEAELQTLSGVGPAKSQAIIAYRTETGPFQTIEDIKKVSGFGEKTFERLQTSITVQ